jgi:hypothetical protein
MAKNEELRFSFGSGEDLADSNGRAECDICCAGFEVPEVEITIRGFIICPSCIQAGPQAVAAEAKISARDKYRIANRCEDPVDQRDQKKKYLIVAKQLRCFDSFMDLPGGYVAIAIAYAPPNDPRRPHGGLRPKDVGRGRKAA